MLPTIPSNLNYSDPVYSGGIQNEKNALQRSANANKIVSAVDTPLHSLKRSSEEFRDIAKELHAKYLKTNTIAGIAKRNAYVANQQQAEKTIEALKKVSAAQNDDHPLAPEAINAIRKKEYIEAIAEQIKAEHANKLATEVEKLAEQLFIAAKKAEEAAVAVDLIRVSDLINTKIQGAKNTHVKMRKIITETEHLVNKAQAEAVRMYTDLNELEDLITAQPTAVDNSLPSKLRP